MTDQISRSSHAAHATSYLAPPPTPNTSPARPRSAHRASDKLTYAPKTRRVALHGVHLPLHESQVQKSPWEHRVHVGVMVSCYVEALVLGTVLGGWAGDMLACALDLPPTLGVWAGGLAGGAGLGWGSLQVTGALAPLHP